jgi:hypothetical protein
VFKKGGKRVKNEANEGKQPFHPVIPPSLVSRNAAEPAGLPVYRFARVAGEFRFDVFNHDFAAALAAREGVRCFRGGLRASFPFSVPVLLTLGLFYYIL